MARHQLRAARRQRTGEVGDGQHRDVRSGEQRHPLLSRDEAAGEVRQAHASRGRRGRRRARDGAACGKPRTFAHGADAAHDARHALRVAAGERDACPSQVPGRARRDGGGLEAGRGGECVREAAQAADRGGPGGNRGQERPCGRKGAAQAARLFCERGSHMARHALAGRGARRARTRRDGACVQARGAFGQARQGRGAWRHGCGTQGVRRPAREDRHGYAAWTAGRAGRDADRGRRAREARQGQRRRGRSVPGLDGRTGNGERGTGRGVRRSARPACSVRS